MFRQALKSIQERYIANSSAEKEWKLASEGYMPMTPSILKEFEIDVTKAYHTTDMDGLETLKKLQGSKKEISAFFLGSEGLSQGARTLTEVVVELSGKSSFHAVTDFYSALSRNGYKWLRPLMTEKDYVVNNDFSVPMFGKMIEYFSVKDRFAVRNVVKNLDGKGKANFVKWYMDESKKLITKKLLTKIQDSISKRSHDTFNNDELFLHQFKIDSVDVVKEKISSRLDDSERQEKWNERKLSIEELGLKFGKFIEIKEISKLGR